LRPLGELVELEESCTNHSTSAEGQEVDSAHGMEEPVRLS